MLDIPELERRWRRYRRKKQLPKTIALSLFILLVASAGLFVFFPLHKAADPDQENNARTTSPVPVEVASPSPVITPTTVSGISQHSSAAPAPAVTAMSSASSMQTVAIQHASVEKLSVSSAPPQQPKTTTLTPSMGFMQDFESDVMRYYVNTPSSNTQTSSVAPRPKVNAASIPTQHDSLPTIIPIHSSMASEPPKTASQMDSHSSSAHIQQSSTRKTMHIQRESDMKDIQDVIARFKKNKNPALSLFVAKRYYNIGNYQQAYNYALITNELDSNIEDSWLIFSKSLYYLNQKEMAIKTLQTYYQDSGSVKAKIALDQMNNGELTE